MCLYPFFLKSVNSLVPCGKCVECFKTYSIEFAIRCMLEAREHIDNCFVTLTYNNENCPDVISKRELQLFTKRLRFHLDNLGITIRVFQAGEYGEKSSRPHYHMIIFGWCPSDLVYLYTTKKGEKIYNSSFLSSIWSKGFISVGSLTFESAIYCAKYMQKLAIKDDNVTKPFILSSRRPGIGGLPNTIDYIVKCLDTDKVYLNGKCYPIPHYYLKLLEKNPLYADKVANIRSNRSSLAINRDVNVLKIKRGKFLTFSGERKDRKLWLSDNNIEIGS